MGASPNGVPLSATDSTGPLSGLFPLETLAGDDVRPTGQGDIAVRKKFLDRSEFKNNGPACVPQRVDTIRIVVIAALLLSCFSNGDHVLLVDFPIFLEPPAMLKTLLPGLFLLSLTVSACKVAEKSEPAADPAPAIQPDVDNSLGGLAVLSENSAETVPEPTPLSLLGQISSRGV